METEYGFYGLPKPDLNIFLDVPSGFLKAKLSGERRGEDRSYLEGGRDIHEADLAFQERVREVYLSQCGSDPDFVRVDCSDAHGDMLALDTIFMKIEALVDKLI